MKRVCYWEAQQLPFLDTYKTRCGNRMAAPSSQFNFCPYCGNAIEYVTPLEAVRLLLNKEKYMNQEKLESLDEFVTHVRDWASERNIYHPLDGSDSYKQFLKAVEEMGELAAALSRGKPVEDHVGDILVCLINTVELSNSNMLDCAQVAWDDIKDRKGKMISGVFVKEADLEKADDEPFL